MTYERAAGCTGALCTPGSRNPATVLPSVFPSNRPPLPHPAAAPPPRELTACGAVCRLVIGHDDAPDDARGAGARGARAPRRSRLQRRQRQPVRQQQAVPARRVLQLRRRRPRHLRGLLVSEHSQRRPPLSLWRSLFLPAGAVGVGLRIRGIETSLSYSSFCLPAAFSWPAVAVGLRLSS